MRIISSQIKWLRVYCNVVFFFFQAEDGIRDLTVTGVQTCALPILENHLVFDRATHSSSASPRQAPLPVQLLPSERTFYDRYSWSLNIYPTIEEAEIGRASCRERV